MTTTGLRDGADAPAQEPDVLVLAPRAADRRSVRALVVMAVVLALAGAGYTLWQRLQPPPDFTLAQLQGAYSGMVRSDGTNEVSTIDASRFPEPPLRISPVECTPLFVSTVSNQFPPAALDGVSTYWIDPGSASISLFTVRYADAAAAAAAYRAVTDATTGCAGQTVRFSGAEDAGQVVETAVSPPPEAPEQVAFQLARGRGEGRYALHVLRLSNTVTWQYRYDVGRGDYDPRPAQQLMNGLSLQLLSIQREADER